MQRTNEDVVYSTPIRGEISEAPFELNLWFNKEIEYVSSEIKIDDSTIMKEAVSIIPITEQTYNKYHLNNPDYTRFTTPFWIMRRIHKVKSRPWFIIKNNFRITETSEVKSIEMDFYMNIRRIN